MLARAVIPGAFYLLLLKSNDGRGGGDKKLL